MDDVYFNIKADEYEPDLFNDMSVQEEITVGSSDNMLNTFPSSNNLDHDFNNTGISSSNQVVKVIKASAIGQQSVELRNKPKVIYLKPGVGENLNNSLKTVKFSNGLKQVKIIPMSKLTQNTQGRIIQLNQNYATLNPGVPRIVNPSFIRSGIQVTKLNNLNINKLPIGQKILISNRPGVKYNNITPIINIQNAGSFSQQNTIVQPISNSQSNQTALKLEPGDSGFYNLTGGNGPTRYYPRMHSPDKDSLDESQEQMANVYKTNGLRKYARSVCDKVKEKGTTTYSEVADELVHEYAAEHPMIPAQQLHYIQKNIRRRVYDALNVLMALKVLDKEKKEIKWKGLPVNLLEECKQLEEEKSRKTELLQQRVEELSELVLQLISYKNLVGRNRQREKESNAPQPNERIKLPFLVITANNNTVIDCNISPEKLEYLFTFDQSFEMQDEFQTLKQSGFTLRLGTPQCTESQYKRCLELVPNTLRFYVEAIYQQRSAIVPDFVSLHRRNMAAAAAAARSSKNLSSVNNVGHNSFLQVTNQAFRNTPGNGTNYWSEHHDSPSLMSEHHHHNISNNNSGSSNKHYDSQKRYNSANNNTSNSSNWGDTSTEPVLPKYRLSLNSVHHNYTTENSSAYDAKYLSETHELEDEIEVMDEEADFPSD